MELLKINLLYYRKEATLEIGICTRNVEAVKFFWKRKHFEERSWKQIWKHLTFWGAVAEAFFIKHGAGMYVKAVKFLWKWKHFEERSWKQTRKRLTLYGAGSGSKKYSTASTSLICTLARKMTSFRKYYCA